VKRILMSGAVGLVLCLVFGGAAKADNAHFCDVATGCGAQLP
jgi:hypothetical protein